jgi:hypothetical protein
MDRWSATAATGPELSSRGEQRPCSGGPRGVRWFSRGASRSATIGNAEGADATV